MHFRHITPEQGLSGSTVYSFTQDSKGFMWFATDGGVCRFDGTNFERFTIEDGLGDNEVFQVHEDREGRLWFRTFNGRVSYFFNKKFYNDSNTEWLKEAKVSSSWISFYQDHKGRIWLGAFNGTLVCIENQDVRILKMDVSRNEADCRAFVYEDSDDHVYAHINNRRFIFDEESGDFKLQRVSSQKGRTSFYQTYGNQTIFNCENKLYRLNSDQTDSCIIDMGNRQIQYAVGIDEYIYLTTSDGVFVFNHKFELLSHWLEGEFTTYIMRDTEGNFWISAYANAAFMLPATELKKFRIADAPAQLNEKIYCMTKEPRGRIWAGGSNNKLMCISENDIRTYQLPRSENAVNMMVDVEVLSDGRILATSSNATYMVNEDGTFHTLKFKEPVSGLASYNSAAKDISIDKLGDAWTCHSVAFAHLEISGGEEMLVSSRINEFGKRTFCSHFDTNNNLWLATISGLEFHPYDNGEYGEPKTVFEGRVIDMDETGDGTIVAATDGYGLLLINEKVDTISENNGLSSAICRDVYVNGTEIFVATNRGISKIHYSVSDSIEVVNFGIVEGLPSIDVRAVVVRDNQIFAASDRGLSIIPHNNGSISSSPPPVFIRRIADSNGELPAHSQISLHYLRNFLSVECAAITFTFPDQVKFQYSFDMEPQSWIDSDSRFLLLKNLPFGNHSLRIRARKADSVWSEPVSLAFTVNPPFWLTTWFKLLAVLAPVLLVLGFIIYRYNTLKRKQALRAHMLELELKAMKAQMNPHFVFNVLNSINYFIAENDKAAAQDYLAKFSRLVRSILDNSERVFNTVKNELQMLEWYVELEQLRFEDRLKYRIYAEEGIHAATVQIPSMIIQPYVENAIKHGLPKNGSRMNLTVKLGREKNSILCQVIDDGVGLLKNGNATETIEEKRTSSTKLLRHRLELLEKLYGYRIEISTIDVRTHYGIGNGTHVTMNFPLEINTAKHENNVD